MDIKTETPLSSSFIHSLIHSYEQHALSAFYMPSITQKPRNTVVNQLNKFPTVME